MGEEKSYSLKYHPLVPSDIASLDPSRRAETLFAIENKLLVEPQVFGKPLRHSLKNCRSLRVGDYRVVFRIEKKTVKILAIVHRSSGYKEAEKRARR